MLRLIVASGRLDSTIVSPMSFELRLAGKVQTVWSRETVARWVER